MTNYDKIGVIIGVITLLITISIFIFQQYNSSIQEKKLEKLIVETAMNKQILTSLKI
jgi:hypothetical protein